MWLLGYNNRIRLRIDHTKIDSDLLNFPILLSLSNSSGIGNTDLSRYFNEVGDNSKKCAVTTWNKTQCFVEKEQFEYTNKKACFWINVPKIYSAIDTDLFFYYNPIYPNNISYVGDIGSVAGQSVWNSGFEFVCHMAQDPSGGAGCMKDSTSNTVNGTSFGGMTSGDLVDGKIGKALDIDNVDDYVRYSGLSGISNAITLESVVKMNTLTSSINRLLTVDADIAVLRHEGSAVVGQYRFFIKTDGTLRFLDVASQFDTNWASFTGVWDGTNQIGYKNGVQIGIQTPGGSLSAIVGSIKASTNSENLNGIADEIRVSNVARSASWLKATHHSNFDTLIKYGQIETFNSNRRNNTVREIGGLSYGSRR